MNTNSTEREIKKIGEIWITPQTLKEHFPHDCVVHCEPLEMKINKTFPVFLKKSDGIKYDVYGKNREDYDVVLNKIKNGIKKENEHES